MTGTMAGGKRGVLAAVVAGAALLAPAHARAAPIVLPKPGEVGFAGMAQYGTLFKGGEIGEDFGAGPGFALRLRYRLRYERGLGLTFERHGFNPRVKSAADTAAETSTMLCTGAEIHQMFGTRTRTVRILTAALGLAQVSQKLNNGDAFVSGTGVGDGFFVGAGGELEYFFWRSWAMDFGLRYQAVILHGTTNHEVQIGAGLIFYASD